MREMAIEKEYDGHVVFQAPANHKVKLRFVDEFGVFADADGQCAHWVEVNYGKHFGSPGPR